MISIRNEVLGQEYKEVLMEIASESKSEKNRLMAFKLIQYNFSEQIEQIELKKSGKIGYVYFIGEYFSGTVKIGKAKNLDRRLNLFGLKLPFRWKLIHKIKTKNYDLVELDFHNFFNHKRTNGEWFKLDKVDINIIKSKEHCNKISDNIDMIE